MAKTDANPPMPAFPGEYVLQEIAPDDLSKSVKPKQFLHIDQSECIMCEGCVDICPWKCIHMLGTDTVTEALNTIEPGIDPDEHVVGRVLTGLLGVGGLGDGLGRHHVDALPRADVHAALAHDALGLVDVDELLRLDRLGEVVGVHLDELVLVAPLGHRGVGVGSSHAQPFLTSGRP